MKATAILQAAQRLTLPMQIDLSAWVCVAADDGEGTIHEDAIGKRTLDVELRLPRFTLGIDADQAEQAAQLLAKLLNGRVNPCAGGKFGNSWIVRAKLAIDDGGDIQVESRLED